MLLAEELACRHKNTGFCLYYSFEEIYCVSIQKLHDVIVKTIYVEGKLARIIGMVLLSRKWLDWRDIFKRMMYYIWYVFGWWNLWYNLVSSVEQFLQCDWLWPIIWINNNNVSPYPCRNWGFTKMICWSLWLFSFRFYLKKSNGIT